MNELTTIIINNVRMLFLQSFEGCDLGCLVCFHIEQIISRRGLKQKSHLSQFNLR